MKRKKLFSEIPCLRDDRIVLRKVTPEDADALQELVDSPSVYRYLPAFLYEKRYPDIRHVIRHLYDECFPESLILGIYENERFCGLAELYGYHEPVRRISIGYRLLKSCWGRGLASNTVRLLTAYLIQETDIRIITARTMTENHASANVLKKNGFRLIEHAVSEDWGYETPTLTDKWSLAIENST